MNIKTYVVIESKKLKKKMITIQKPDKYDITTYYM